MAQQLANRGEPTYLEYTATLGNTDTALDHSKCRKECKKMEPSSEQTERTIAQPQRKNHLKFRTPTDVLVCVYMRDSFGKRSVVVRFGVVIARVANDQNNTTEPSHTNLQRKFCISFHKHHPQTVSAFGIWGKYIF